MIDLFQIDLNVKIKIVNNTFEISVLKNINDDTNI